MGPARLSADSDQKVVKDLNRWRFQLATLSQTSSTSPSQADASKTTSTSTATASQLSAEKTLLINKALIDKAEKAPLSDSESPCNNLEQSSGDAYDPAQLVAGNSRRGT